ncbi:unnamed protein product [Gongylonema pulchrum]|uniref:Protein roadkill n=1 Tax=Gongylonema pulchrum TaxID=637853 RepID=A0A183CZP9_9BILA|nr:unnamed protein product [Gongylonema pulchrum]
MNTLNATVMETNAPGAYHHRWNLLTPSLLSENGDENNTSEVCRAIKIEHPFDTDEHPAFFRTGSAATAASVAQQLQRRQSVTSASPVATPTIPLASCATAAASLSSAFSKRSATLNRNQQQQQHHHHQLQQQRQQQPQQQLQQQQNGARMRADEAHLTSECDSSKQTLEVNKYLLLDIETHPNRSRTVNIRLARQHKHSYQTP